MAILGAEPITLRRATGPTTGPDANGSPVPAPTVDTTISASWQPLNGPEMQTLPLGDRARSPHWACTTAVLNTVDQFDGTPPDLLVVDGIVYQIRQTGTYRKVLPHTEVLALRVQETSPGATP